MRLNAVHLYGLFVEIFVDKVIHLHSADKVFYYCFQTTRLMSQVDGGGGGGGGGGGTLKRPSLGNVSQASSMMTIATTLATSSLVDMLRKPFRRKSVPNSGNGGGGGGGNAQSTDATHHPAGQTNQCNAVTTTTASSGVGSNSADNSNHYHSDSLDGCNDGSVIVDMRPIVTPVPYQTFADNNANSYLPGVVSFFLFVLLFY